MFRGTLARDQAIAATGALHETGGNFQRRSESQAEGIWVFSLPDLGGYVVIVQDRQTFRNENGLRTEAISAVYFVPASRVISDSSLTEFSRADAGGRDALEGVQRLHGMVDVERWKSDGDFRIRIAARSSAPHGVAIEGELKRFERWEFTPLRYVIGVLAFTGAWIRGDSAP